MLVVPKRKYRATIVLGILVSGILFWFYIRESQSDELVYFPRKRIAKENFTKIKTCSCTKNTRLPVGHHTSDLASIDIPSTCNDESLKYYGLNQNVISFSLFYPPSPDMDAELEQKITRDFISGIEINAERMRKLFPGWLIRIYTDADLNLEYCKVLCDNHDVFWCDIRETPSHGDLSDMDFRTWRFLLLGDPTVDVFLSRDLDSLLTSREAAAIKDWLSSTKAISVLRDRPVHNAPIMGGLWGANNNRLTDEQDTEIQRQIIVKANNSRLRDTRGFDQQVAREVIYQDQYWPLIVAYDSYNCERFGKETLVRPFPTKRNGSYFVGLPGLVEETDVPLIACPESCRPEYDKMLANHTWIRQRKPIIMYGMGYLESGASTLLIEVKTISRNILNLALVILAFVFVVEVSVPHLEESGNSNLNSGIEHPNNETETTTMRQMKR